MVIGETLIREMPTSVSLGQSFTVTYKITDTSGLTSNYGVLIEDTITGGCTPSSVSTGFLSPATQSDITYTAPSSGDSCQFIGTYQFSDADGPKSEKTLESQSITMGSNGCVPDCTGKSCGTDGCGGSCGSCSTGLFCSSGNCIVIPEDTTTSDEGLPGWIWIIVAVGIGAFIIKKLSD